MPGQSSTLDTSLGKWSKYKEDCYSLYFNLIFESERIDLEGGTRLECSNIKYKIDPANKYYQKNESYSTFSLFPNIRFTYKINGTNKLSLFYNKRVDRPDEFDLRPFPKYDDPEILKTGNPYLRPQYTHLFEASWKTSWNSGSLYISGYYKKINHIFTRIYTNSTDNSGIVNSITQNLNNGSNYGFELIGEQQLCSFLRADANFNWYRNIINASYGTALYPYEQTFQFDKSTSNTWNLKLNLATSIQKSFKLQVSYIYYAPNIIPQGKIKSRSSLDLGMVKRAFHDKAEFSLSFNDILNKFSLRQDITGNGFTLNSENYNETKIVTLGMKYKF